ncbi:MAG: hypothetical protein EPN97_14650 [Alphaproteobacteria bacterium]|nr:MAG: hypothetical protein EPN97_14650 [Alphaproteobacteria bacterium]
MENRKLSDFVREKIAAARSTMRQAEKTIRDLDDDLILGAFEIVKIGEYFKLKAQSSPGKAEGLHSLADVFNRTGRAVLKSLERKGYKLSPADKEAYGKVDAWKAGFYENPDPVVQEEINAFIMSKMDDFAQEHPKVWTRIAKKNPELARKVKFKPS